MFITLWLRVFSPTLRHSPAATHSSLFTNFWIILCTCCLCLFRVILLVDIHWFYVLLLKLISGSLTYVQLANHCDLMQQTCNIHWKTTYFKISFVTHLREKRPRNKNWKVNEITRQREKQQLAMMALSSGSQTGRDFLPGGDCHGFSWGIVTTDWPTKTFVISNFLLA